MNVLAVYEGSDGEATKRLYSELARRGLVGEVALNLFRAQKCSSRAKVYRGGIRGRGSFRDMAYQRKGWSMQNLCRILAQLEQAHGPLLLWGEPAPLAGVESEIPAWGWRRDPSAEYGATWVLYVDIAGAGQASFHSHLRYEGPDYAGDWDGSNASAERIVGFCQRVLERPAVR